MIRGGVSEQRASGTLSLTTTYRWPDGRYQACKTGSVGWTAD